MPLSNESSNVTLSAINPAIQPPASQAVVYTGVQAQIVVTLNNSTGSAILLQSGAQNSTLQVFAPMFYTSTEVLAMAISLADWTFSTDPGGAFLLLTYNGPNGAQWADGANIQFTITNATSNAQPTADSFQVNSSNFTGNVPTQLTTPFNLAQQPQPGNAKLSDTLQISLDNQGSVYVTTSASDPLSNQIFLNIKNTGSTPVYNGQAPWTGSPQVIVTFVYGLTAGALAQDNDKQQPAIGSAWNIQAAVFVDEGNGWYPTNPSITGQNPHPQWILSPSTTNTGILGTGADANVTFSFSSVVSLTPPGHTQMIVEFTGFQKDENTAYDDQVFVIDIFKQQAPPTRGLINFFAPNPIVMVNQPNQPVAIPFRWAMFDVPNVHLICSMSGVPPLVRNYPNPQPLAYDTYPLTLPQVQQNTPLFVTLQAFDGNGGYLNSLQFTVFLQVTFFYDPRDGQVYSAVLLGNLWWMAQNLNYNAPGSIYYNNYDGYAAQYGRLYPAAGLAPAPYPWRVPSEADWNALLQVFGGSPTAAYKALINLGSSGCDMQLGGTADNNQDFNGLGNSGFYWTSTPATSSSTLYANFGLTSGQLNLGTDLAFDNSYYASVRYVMDA